MASGARLVLLLTGILAASPGCLVLSLSPLYDDDRVEYDAQLLGTWTEADSGTTLLIEKGEWRSYHVTWTEKTYAWHATARLTVVAGERFLDVMSPAGEERSPLLVPAHGFCRIAIVGQTLSVEVLDLDAITDRRRGLISASRYALDERGNALLTGSTRALRAWLLSVRSRPGVFLPPMVFTRTAAPSMPPALTGPGSEATEGASLSP